MRFLGWVGDGKLEGLYAAPVLRVPVARGGLRPARARGDGAAACPSPARGPRCPEVAGEGGLLFRPTDPAAIAAALERSSATAAARACAAAGPEQAARFTWEATARETLESYDRALAGCEHALVGRREPFRRGGARVAGDELGRVIGPRSGRRAQGAGGERLGQPFQSPGEK